MDALIFDAFGGVLRKADVPLPEVPAHAAVIRVRATGVCRSDWHAWQGHDDSVHLPHVPGHEFAGVVERVGAQVRRFDPGQRVTAPFVNSCGACDTCRGGMQTACPHQTQPGFDRWGTWAEFVVVHHADVNLVALPDGVDDVTAAGLGCRFATAYRAVATLAEVRRGETVAVFGCGGVGLAVVMVAASRGARVVAIDRSASALAMAAQVGAAETVAADADPPGRLAALGGAAVTVDALGRTEVLTQAIAALRPGGRHVQVGLLLGDDASPRVDLGRVIAKELRIIGSHGMAARDYPAMLDEIARGALDPARLVGRIGDLDAASDVLHAMSDGTQTPGTTVLRI